MKTAQTVIINPTPFRALTRDELSAITAWMERDPKFFPTAPISLLFDHMTVSYRRHRGNFTICTLAATYVHPKRSSRGLSYQIWTGATRRHDNDKPNHLRGELESLRRALMAKPITIPYGPSESSPINSGKFYLAE